MNKQDLIRQIQESRRALEGVWSKASEQQMSEIPGPQPGWTVKACIAHLTYWEHATLDRLNGRVLADSWGDVDKINAELLVKSQARSIDEVLRKFNESGRQIISEIELLTDEQLLLPGPWKDGRTLGEHLADDTFIHYEEHQKKLHAWAEKNLKKRSEKV